MAWYLIKHRDNFTFTVLLNNVKPYFRHNFVNNFQMEGIWLDTYVSVLHWGNYIKKFIVSLKIEVIMVTCWINSCRYLITLFP
jgi:hypothetical protein